MKKLMLPILLVLSAICTQAQINGIWKDIGPFDFPPHENWQIAGVARISQLKFHPTDPQTLYAVNAMGGLFITNNGGENWRSTGVDDLPATRCASVCVDHTNDNVLYYGTGDLSYYSPGLGIWKSTDGGNSFTRSSNGVDNRLISEIIMAPNNNNILIVATNDGLWKTTDAGNNWSAVKGGGAFTDLVFQPGSNDIMYATTKSEFWKSTNQDESWSRIGLPGSGIENGGRIAVSKDNSNVVYLSFVGNYNGGTSTPVLKSDNAGDSFYVVKSAGGWNLNGYDENSNGQGNYNFAFSADPSNSNHLFICGHIIWESTDGGANWVKISVDWANQVHTDMRQIPFSPFDSNVVYNVNDGGIWKSSNAGKSFLPLCNGLAGTESYVGCQSPVKKEAISIGAQDNGEFIYKDGVWFNNAGGDVHRNMVHDNISADYYYDLSGNGRRRYLPNGGFVDLNMPFSSSDGNAQDVYTAFPLTQTDVGFFSYFDVYRANNLSNNPPTWTKISNINKRIKAVASSPTDANVLYFITDNNQVHRSDNALSGAPSFTTYNLPNNTNVTASITVVKSNTDIVYAVCNSKVYRSTNKGANWSEITGTLPGVNYHTVLHDTYSSNEAIYLAGYNTVWYRDNSMNDWINYSSGLPTVVNFRKIYMYNDGTNNSVLTAITGGRSVFRAGLYEKNILREPENPIDVIPGMVYNYYELDDLNRLPVFSRLTPTKTGAAQIPNVAVRLKDDDFALQFQGYIDIPTDGKYTFYLTSDDGSKMFIGDQEVVGNDGLHGAIEQSGYAWLEQGKHVITIEYFELGGDEELNFSWEGPSITKQLVPAEVLWQLSPESICPTNGTISVERWNNVSGNSVANIPVGSTPSETTEATLFESEPTNGDNYGARYRGFICPPYSGEYTFYVSSDDHSELWLSTDDSEANKEKIAYLEGSVQLRNWYKNESQKSAPIYLEAGRQYYVEGLHKEGAGGDNFAVAWLMPSSDFQAPIEGKHLSPYSTNEPPEISLIEPTDGNAFEMGTTISIKANATDDESVVSIEFYVNDIKVSTVESAPYEYTWTPELKGTHKIHARAVDNLGRVAITTKSNVQIYDLRPADLPEFSVQGLDYKYYEGDWSNLPDFTTLTEVESGTNAQINLDPGMQEEYFGLVYTGYVKVPIDGYYEFFLDSDDGSSFFIGNENIILHDGIHGMSNAKMGGIGLKAGKHAITFNYFQRLGGKDISIQIKGGGLTQQEITDDMWYRQTFTNAKPVVTVLGKVVSDSQPGEITFTATATDDDGDINHLNFYQNNELVKISTLATDSILRTSLNSGTYTFYVTAYDNLGDSTESSPWTITIDAANQAPSVSITNPVDQELFMAPANISFEVDAVDSDGAITQVDFFNGPILLQTITETPYVFEWTSVPAGTYELSAKATDDEGAVSSSDTLTIKVDIASNTEIEALISSAQGLKVFPNPVLTTTQLKFDIVKGGEAQVKLVDMNGKIHVNRSLGTLTSGNQLIDLNVDELAVGQYVVVVQIGNEQLSSLIMRAQKPKKDIE